MTTTPSKLQNSLAAKSKSPIKYNIREDSPSSRVVEKSKTHTNSKLEEMRVRRQNLIECFDIYQLLYQNGAPQRCIAHNNFLTLYCENEHKLLCVNCVYGDTAHKNHRLIPIKNAFKKIQEDNALMRKHLKQYIEEVKLLERNALSSKQQSQATLKAVLHQLEDQYTLTANALEDKYHRMRDSIVSSFRSDTGYVEVLAKQLDWFKNTYIQKERGLPTSDDQSSLIFTHNILTIMLENDSLKQNRIDSIDFNEIKINTINELKRITQMIGNPAGHPGKKRIF